MIQRIRPLLNLVLAASLLGSTLWITPAAARMIGTDNVAAGA